LEKMLEYDLAILGYEVSDVSKFGIIKTDKSGRMIKVIEKPKKSKDKFAATGVYMLNKDFFKYKLVSIGNGEYGLPQTLAQMARDHEVRVERATIWHPISSPEDLKKAEEVLHRFL